MKRSVASGRVGLAGVILAAALGLFGAGCPEQGNVCPPAVGAGASSGAAAAGVASTAPVASAPAAGLSFRDTPVPAETRVVVVGGGLSGLIAGYELQKAGVAAHVLEATDRVGGRVATAYYADGAQGEFGMQEVWEDNPLFEMSKELGIKFEDKAEAEQVYSSFVAEDASKKPAAPKLFSFMDPDPKKFFRAIANDADPAQTDKTIAAFERWLEQARKLRERAIEKGLADPEVKRLQGISFEDWFKEAKLPARMAEFIQMTSDCELGSQWHQYSALFGLLEFGIFLEDAETYHAKAGNQAIVEALAKAQPGRLTTSVRVLRIRMPDKDKPGKGEISVEYSRDGHVSVIKAERVVLAIPWTRLHELDLSPKLSKAKWDGVESLGRGQYTVVHFIVDKKEGDKLWRDNKGKTPFPVLSNGPLGVIYGVRGEGSEAAPTDVFGLLVYGKSSYRLHYKTNEEVEAMLAPELDRIWPGFQKLVQATYVYGYHPGAIPYWPVGRSPIDDKSVELFRPEHGLYLAGDYLMSAHSVGAVKSAKCAADRIAADLAGKPAETGLCMYRPKGK